MADTIVCCFKVEQDLLRLGVRESNAEGVAWQVTTCGRLRKVTSHYLEPSRVPHPLRFKGAGLASITVSDVPWQTPPDYLSEEM